MTAQARTTVPGHSILAGITRGARFVFDMFAHASIGARCAREAERLSAMSDAELARRGLRRDQIIRHAFGPYFAL